MNTENQSKTTISLYLADESVSQEPTEHLNSTCEVYLSKNQMRLNWIALYSDDSNSQLTEFCQCFRAVYILLVTQFTHIMAISIFICAIMCRRAINEQIYSEKWRIYVLNAMQSFLRSRGPSVHFDLTTFHIYVTRRADNEKVNYHARTPYVSHSYTCGMQFLLIQLFQSFPPPIHDFVACSVFQRFILFNKPANTLKLPFVS